MRRKEPDATVNSSSDGSPCPSSAGTSQHLDSRVSDAQSTSFGTRSGRSKSSRSPSSLQFFVRMLSEGYNLVIQADANDSVKSLHERIQAITGIPLFEQRLIYRGKQLQWEQSLSDCSIENDASLQLVGRLQSTEHPHAWQVIDGMISMICQLCKGELFPSALKDIKNCMTEYFSMTPKLVNDSATSHLRIFMSSSAPAALVMLYASPIKVNKEFGESSVQHFLALIRNSLHNPLNNQCAPMLLEFCKLLRRVGYEDPLYVSCRNALGSLLENVATSNGHGSALPDNVKELFGVQEIFPFVSELSKSLSRDLVSSMELTGCAGPSVTDVRDFAAFLLPLCNAITEQVGFKGPISVMLDGTGYEHLSYGEEIKFLHRIFRDLLYRMDQCLHKMEDHLTGKGEGDGDVAQTRWSQYLSILKELNIISKLYQDAEERFWAVLRHRRSSFCVLIVKYAKRSDDNQWILKHKNVLDFESRRHLAMISNSRVSDAQSASFGTRSGRSKSSRSPSSLQFFVRVLSEGYNLVIQADANDSVKSLHERIQAITGIRLFEQRLIYRGKQLQWEHSLSDCSIQNDASLQLVGRLRSTEHPHAWQVIDDMISMICRLCKGELFPSAVKDIKNCMTEYFSMTTKDENDSATSHLRIFMSSSAPAALVMLYASPIKVNKEFGESSVKNFLALIRNSSQKSLNNQYAPMLLEFCKLLRRVGYEDPLYVSCRNALGSLLENVATSNSHGSALHDNVKELFGVQEIFPFVSELSKSLSRDLVSSMELTGCAGPSVTDVRDFAAFLLPLCNAITEQVGFKGPISVMLDGTGYEHLSYGEEIKFLHRIFLDLLYRMDQCLHKIEDHLTGKGEGDGDVAQTRWSQYLSILKELNIISKLYQDAEERFWAVLRRRRSSFCVLIVKYAKQSDDNQWILKRKGVLDFASRTHLAMISNSG